MVDRKSEVEIQALKRSNDLVSLTLAEIAKWLNPGISTGRLNEIADAFIRDHGGIPAFLGYRGFPASICVSVNEQVVHGIPGSYILKEGDLVSVDCGVNLDGWYGDSAFSFVLPPADELVEDLLSVTRKCLLAGIEQAVSGKRTGDIGFAIQQMAESHGFSVVRELVGHGVGRSLHEKPEVPNFGKRGSGALLKEGMTIAIEPMINMGSKEVYCDSDGWTIFAADRKPSAHFEHSVVIRKEKAEILSNFRYIDEIIKEKQGCQSNH